MVFPNPCFPFNFVGKNKYNRNEKIINICLRVARLDGM